MSPSSLKVDKYAAPRSGREPVVLLHGLGSRGDDWGLQVHALSEHYDVYTLDLPGHGASPPIHGWPAIADYAGVVTDWMATERLGSAHIVGLSLGGLIALQIGLDRREQVRSLTIVNAFSRMRFGVRGSLHSAGRLLLLMFGRMDWLGTWVASALFPEKGQEAVRRIAAQRIAATSRRSYLQAVAAVARFNLDERIHELNGPVLIVSGDRDLIVPMSLKRALADDIPHARFETIPGSGHVSPVDASERFNALLLDFLGKK
jgi:pimeloyl-ACP methyl ester carboxylesterase